MLNGLVVFSDVVNVGKCSVGKVLTLSQCWSAVFPAMSKGGPGALSRGTL